jgi:hypothetical protein
LIVRLTPDMKNYTYWVVDPLSAGTVQGLQAGVPIEPLNALGNRTTSKATMGTNIQNELPTLST